MPVWAGILAFVSCGQGRTSQTVETIDSLELADSLESDSAFLFEEEEK